MDQRYYNSNRKEYDFFVSEHSELFGEITGMPVKSGLPFFNSISLLQNVKEKEVKILSLPEVILRGLKAKNFGVHSSMIAASGFYDIYKKEISVDLCKMHRKVTGKNVIFNPVSYGFDLYEIQVNAKPVKVSIGYGDHQCSVLGAENDHQTVSLNLGTGSQVSKIIPEDKIASIARNNQLQKRPYFNTDYLVCVTHIPSGRVLNQFIGLFKGDIWKDVQKLSLADVKKATLRFDLSVFNDAWGFSGGGSVTNLQEGGISYHNFISSLIRSYIFQYIRIVNMLEESLKTKSDSIILSGGVAQRIPAIKKLLTAELSRKIIQKRVFKDRDEAILGLKKILLQTK
jgi:sugar (pentulose or hexulose) kinase